MRLLSLIFLMAFIFDAYGQCFIINNDQKLEIDALTLYNAKINGSVILQDSRTCANANFEMLQSLGEPKEMIHKETLAGEEYIIKYEGLEFYYNNLEDPGVFRLGVIKFLSDSSRLVSQGKPLFIMNKPIHDFIINKNKEIELSENELHINVTMVDAVWIKVIHINGAIKEVWIYL